MIEDIFSRVDTLSEKLNIQRQDLNTVAETILDHEERITMNERTNKKIEVRMVGKENYIEDNFESIKEFWKDAIKNKELRQTQSMEEHHTNAKQIVEEQTVSKVKSSSSMQPHIPLNNPNTSNTPPSGNDIRQTDTSLMARLIQIASRKTH